MKTLRPYLIFPGTCEEALSFYARCLDGEVVLLQRFGEAPVDLGTGHEDRIFNAVFRAGDLEFMASDAPPDQNPGSGSNFAMFAAFSDPDEHQRAFEGLARGGRVMMPPDTGFGMLQDRYGVRWMLALEDGPAD